MLNRRDFVQSAGTVLAGGLITWNAAANPLAWHRQAGPIYTPTALRWTGASFAVLHAENARLGDFVVFSPVRGDRTAGPFDVFMCDETPPGDNRESMLRPLGRFGRGDAIRPTLFAELRAFAQTNQS